MQVVIAGGGVAGLTAALALARQGHRVQVVDRDDSPRPADVTAAAEWSRRGVAQFQQPHAFLARLFQELDHGLPDVLDGLRAIGVPQVELIDGLQAMWCRRSTLEWVMRGMAEAEPGVTVVYAAVADVRVEHGAVTGVGLADGRVLPADLVVDATGRRGRVSRRWLRETVDEPADEVYTSRRYRTLPSTSFGPVNRGVISVAEGDGYSVLVFPHDAGVFTVCFTRLPDDPELAVLRETPVFEAATRQVPLTADWTDAQRAEPVSDVVVMGGLRNSFRVLHESAPLGLQPLADAVCTTNPHFGRGSSLAVAHALRLADAVAAAPEDARSWRGQLDAWERGELRAWFDDARCTDQARAAMWRTVRDGRLPTGVPPTARGGPAEVPHLMVLAAAGADRTVARAVLRHMHLVDPPAALESVHPRVADLLAQGWLPGRPVPGAASPGPERTPGGAPGAPAAPPRHELVEELRSPTGSR
ncbi:NAD(P)/FAD-dependent oxidoreductase [Modestobacter altitudinis]|uniref:NAD(P)/FAD-dependent oxidoreductase n=1 Tax=Modestobacter altitudinis TaxID=2213158 RepID=UPI00110CA82A|nr:FAD-dependent oxidoreductase [Modestobacter altitudinis]